MSVRAPGPAARPSAPARPRVARCLSLRTRLLHWSVALGVIGLLGYGFVLQWLPSGAAKTGAVQVHKSLGMLVFALALGRMSWRLREGFPPGLGPSPRWERRAAWVVHVILIAATLIMPLTGILRSLAYARPIAVFGIPVIPQLFAAKNEPLYALAASLHDALAVGLAVLVALHAAVALKHHWIDRDDTLRRMMWARR